jgi:hypothetical protein
MSDEKSNVLMNGDNMTGIDNPMHLAARIKGMAGLLACALAVFSPGSVLGQIGPILPSQTDRVVNGLTTLVVANTAVETNFPPGQQYGTVLKTNHLTFSYPNRDALLADGWSFMAKTGGTNRNTEITNSAQGLVIDYDQSAHPGSINVPSDLGDLWNINNHANRVYPTRNFLSRALPPNWIRVDVTAYWVPGMYTQQASFNLYQDDDNLIVHSLGYAPWRPSHTLPDGSQDPAGGNSTTEKEACAWVYSGTNALSYAGAQWSPHVHAYPFNIGGGNGTHGLRWVRYTTGDNNNCVLPFWSWIENAFGDTGDVYTLTGYPQPPQLVNPRIAIWTGCDPPATPGAVNMILSEYQVISLEPAVTLTYRLVNPPAGASIDANGIITWTPAIGQFPSTNVFTTIVTDNSVPPVSATNSFTVVAEDMNAAPTLPPQPDRTISILNTLTVANTAAEADPNAQPLSYQLTVAPPGATIDGNGIISWTPGTGQQHTTNLFVTVVTSYDPQAANAQSLSATNSFNVVVLPLPWPVLPNQPACPVRQFTTMTVTNTAVDGALTVNQIATNTIVFNYADRDALLADGWSFMASGRNNPNTEITTGLGQIDYNQFAHPGVLNIPCDLGDLLGTTYNNTRNSLFRSLPSGWQSVRLALIFAPVTADYQQAHLGLYQDDDNYVQMGVAYNHWDPIGNQRFTLDRESGGFAPPPAEAPTTSTTLNFRLDRNPANSTVTAYYSLDGATWTVLGTTALTLANPRLMIWTGGAPTAYAGSGAIMRLQRLDIVAPTAVPTVLSYTLINPPAGATVDGNGIITWQPGAATPAGPYVLTTVVTDNGLPPLSATNSFTVTVVEPPAPPTIKSVIMSTGAAVITWDCAIGSTYRLQFKDDLGQTNWIDLPPDVAAAGHTMTTTNYIGSSPARFFRVLLLH